MIPTTPQVSSLWRSPPHYRPAVTERLLSRGMVARLSAQGKKKVGAKRLYILATGSDQSDVMWGCVREGYDHKDLDLPSVFPNGCGSVKILVVPGTDMVLPVSWRIYFDTGRYAAPPNQCIKKKFDVDWVGNIVVVKHRKRSDFIAQVAYGEEAFADVILGLWLKEFVHVKNRLGVKLHFKSAL